MFLRADKGMVFTEISEPTTRHYYVMIPERWKDRYKQISIKEKYSIITKKK